MRTLCLLAFLLPVLLLQSCNSSSETVPDGETDHAHMVDTARAERNTDEGDFVYSIPDSVASADFAVDTINLSPEPDTPVKILLEGLFHKVEVWAGAENKEWIGLVYKKWRYELRPTSLSVEPAFDPVRDAEAVNEEGRKVISGRQVIGSDSSTLLFLTGLSGLRHGPVDTAVYDTALLTPGKEMPIRFKGKKYTLAAFGDSPIVDSLKHSYGHFGWKITGTKNDRKMEQVLAEDHDVKNSIYVLHWAGDIDRDGIPDLIADISKRYSQMKFTLFLSSKAEKGKLYKQVAVFESNSQ